MGAILSYYSYWYPNVDLTTISDDLPKTNSEISTADEQLESSFENVLQKDIDCSQSLDYPIFQKNIDKDVTGSSKTDTVSSVLSSKTNMNHISLQYTSMLKSKPLRRSPR